MDPDDTAPPPEAPSTIPAPPPSGHELPQELQLPPVTAWTNSYALDWSPLDSPLVPFDDAAIIALDDAALDEE